MVIPDLFTYPQLIFRIVEKQKRGSEFVFQADSGFMSGSRYDQQRNLLVGESAAQKEIARFTFPTNKEGKTIYYNDYQHTMNLRTNVTNGVAGPIAEIYGRGIDEISMRGAFPTIGKRSVILSTEFVPDLKTYEPKDWAQSFKEFIQYFADLNDPYSRLWTDDTYKLDDPFSFKDLFGGGGGSSSNQQNNFLYEFQIIDEYAEQLFSVIPKTPTAYQSSSQPLAYAWSIDFIVVEDLMQAPYKQIPDDIMDLIASFRVPEIGEIPVVGPLSTLMDKMINISNSVSKAMTVLSSYKPGPKFANDVMKLNAANNQIVTQAIALGANKESFQ